MKLKNILVTLACASLLSPVLLTGPVDAQTLHSRGNTMNKPLYGTPAQEAKLGDLIYECLILMGKTPDYPYPPAVREDLPHLETWNIKTIEDYVDKIETDRLNGLVPDLSDPQQKSLYDKNRQIEELYKKLFLQIYHMGIESNFHLSAPESFVKEFAEKSGYSAYIQSLKAEGKYSIDDWRKYDAMYFGSNDAKKLKRQEFYRSKMKDYGIGAD